MVSIISSVALSRKPLVRYLSQGFLCYMCYVWSSFSPGKVSTPVTATAATPTVGELNDFSTSEVLGRSCRALLDHIQLQIPTLQAQPVGDEVGLLQF